jgi:phosphoribosylformylglycinamidine synthase subunit PurQ / glutaminase
VRAAVVLFPGSNADAEMKATLAAVCGAVDVVWHAESSLPPVDLVALPGGFSYGDYLRCGAIAKTSAIMPAIFQHAARGGLVIGVCNGFQILTEAGLLPGALTRNAHLRFECRDLHVRVDADGPFTKGLRGKTLRLPIAHAEGRYQATEAALGELTKQDRIAFRYATSEGTVAASSNPNGSMESIAGIYGGPDRNVLGLMPHPERMSEALHGGTDGRLLFESAAKSIAERAPAMRGSAP